MNEGGADGVRRRPTRPGRSGSDQRLEELYDEHAAALLTFALRYTSDRQAAEDIVQETFLRVWRRIDGLDRSRNPRSYLLTIARNLITDRWRGNKDNTVDLERARNHPHAVDDIDTAMTAILVEEALERLSEDHRAVVQLLFYDGWTAVEAATLLAVPIGTVKSRSYYALKALRGVLDELGVTQ